MELKIRDSNIGSGRLAAPDSLFALDISQRGDALELLKSLPLGSVAAGFFDPQFRELLERQQYGNEGVGRQQARAALPAMTPAYINAATLEFACVLKPSGYLFPWTDKFALCEGHYHLDTPRGDVRALRFEKAGDRLPGRRLPRRGHAQVVRHLRRQHRRAARRPVADCRGTSAISAVRMEARR